MHNSNIISAYTPSQHHIARTGLGYARGLSDDELQRQAPAIFADQAHESRSGRYAYIPTRDLMAGMRAEGFLPVKVSQARARDADRKNFCKHLIRFRRDDQLGASEAREVVMVNSHDGTSGFRLMAGLFRLVCSNGLILGNTDHEIRIRHSGDALATVIEGAYSIVSDFDKVAENIDSMKALTLAPEQSTAFARAALALRFEDTENCGIRPEQIIEPRRAADQKPDLWSTFNVIQENIIKGGLRGRRLDAHGRRVRTSTREIAGIDQNIHLNRGLFVLAQEMRKLLN